MLRLFWAVLALALLVIQGQAQEWHNSIERACHDVPCSSSTHASHKRHSIRALSNHRKFQRSPFPKKENQPALHNERRAYKTSLAPPVTTALPTRTSTRLVVNAGYTLFPTYSLPSPSSSTISSVVVAQPSSFINNNNTNSNDATGSNNDTSSIISSNNDNGGNGTDNSAFSNVSQSIPAEYTNNSVGISVGAAIGGFAVVALAGMLAYSKKQSRARRRTSRPSGTPISEENVQTRWRTHSFMNALSGAVAQLRRSPSNGSQTSSSTKPIQQRTSFASSVQEWNEKDDGQSYTPPPPPSFTSHPPRLPPLSYLKD